MINNISLAEVMWMVEKTYLFSIVMLLGLSYSGLSAIAKLENADVNTILNKLFF
jgi:hypothetical protein